MAFDPATDETVHIGGQTRTLRFNMRALSVCQMAFNGRPVREMIQQLDVGVISQFAAAGFMHESRKVTPDLVLAWLDNEPNAFPRLAAAVSIAITKAYRRMMPKEDADQMGEVLRSQGIDLGETTTQTTNETGGQTSG